LGGGSVWSGKITLTGNARITSYGSAGTVAGNIAGNYDLEAWQGSDGQLYLSGTNTYRNLNLTGWWTYLNKPEAAGLGTIVFAGGGMSAYGSDVVFTNPVTASAGVDVHIGYRSGSLKTTFTGPWYLSGVAHDIHIYENTVTTISGNVDGSGGGALYKNQSGSLILTGTNTFGNTGWSLYNRIGTLTFAGDSVNNAAGALGLVGSSTVNITNNAQLTTTQVYLGNGGSAWGTVNQYGSTLVNLNGADETRILTIGEYPGATSYYNLYGGTLIVTNNATAKTFIGWNGGGWLSIYGGVAILKTIQAAGSDGRLTLTGGELRVGSGGILNTAGPVTVTLGSALLSAFEPWSSAVAMTLTGTNAPTQVSTTGGNITLAGALSGAGGLAKQGSGTLTLGGANTYAGSTVVTNGALFVNGTHTGGGAYAIASGGKLGGVGTINSAVGMAGGTTLENGANNAFGTLTMSSLAVSNATLRAMVGAAPAFRVTSSNGFVAAGANTVEINGGITSTGQYVIVDYTGTLDPASYASLTLSTAQRGLGAALVNNTNNTSVDLVVTNVATLRWTGAVNSSWDVGATTNWQFASDGAPASFLQLDRILFDDTATNFTVLAADGVTPAAIVVSNNAAAYTIGGGAIAGACAFQKSGTGTVVMAGANTYSGATTINGGTLSVDTLANGGSPSPVGASSSAAGNLVLNGGTLRYTGSSLSVNRMFTVSPSGGVIEVSSPASTLTIDGAGWVVNGSVAKRGPGTLSFVSYNYSYPNAALDFVVEEGTLAFDSNYDWNYAPLGGVRVVVTNGATFRSYYGAFGGLPAPTEGNLEQVVVERGSTWLLLGDFRAWIQGWSYGAQGRVVLRGGSILGASYLHPFSGLNIDVLASDLSSYCGAGMSTYYGGGTYTLNVEDGAAAPDFVMAGSISGGVSTWNKNGSGQMNLNGASASATVNINGGTLLVNNTASGAANVATNAMLGGTGTIGGLVSVREGGIVSPGSNTVGTLTVGGLAVSNNAVYVWEKSVAGADRIDIMGTDTLSFASGATVALDVRVSGGELTPGVKRVLMTYKGTAPAALPAWRIVTTNSPVPVKVTGSPVNESAGAGAYNVVLGVSPSSGAILILR
jgi:autotransporter-associated beta strand protein